MSPRFITNLLFALAGGFVVVASQAFSASVTGWITFGIGLGIISVLGLETVEELIGAKGHRRTRGTYLLEELPGVGTEVTFELVWFEAPLVERLGAPFTRAVTRRANAKALRRLVDVPAQTGRSDGGLVGASAAPLPATPASDRAQA